MGVYDSFISFKVRSRLPGDVGFKYIAYQQEMFVILKIRLSLLHIVLATILCNKND